VEDVGTGLRERKKARTRQAIADTARRLFADRGFENVTVAEVARAADVATKTVFNYFPTKEDLVYGRLESFENALLAAIRDRPPGESVLAAFGRFVTEPRGLLAAKDGGEELREITAMIAQSPALLAREQQVFERFTDSLARLLAQEAGAGPDDVEPRVVAHALIGLHRGLLDYVRGGVLAGRSNRSLAAGVRAQAERALARLEQGLGDYGTR